MINNLTISYSLLNGYQNVVQSDGQCCASNTNWTIDHNVLLNGFSSDANHGEWIDTDGKMISNLVVRYNLFKGSNGGMTGIIVANNVDLTGALVYGNIFDNVSVGNGIVTGTSAGSLVNALVYNNTFLTSGAGPWISSGQKGGSGNIARNNLLYNMSGAPGTGVTDDYNAYFSTSNTPSESHGQVGSGSPFVNSSGGNYTLVNPTNAADTSVTAQYRTDMTGKVGTNRGAMQ